jgi:hypothetical protein
MKSKFDQWNDDILAVYKVTNEEGLSFYATEIENDSRNEAFISNYRNSLLTFALDPEKLFKKDGRSLQYEYFVMLNNGYVNFPDRYLSNPELNLQKEVMNSWSKVMKENSKEIGMLYFEEFTSIKDPSTIIKMFERLNSEKKLTKTQLVELKNMARFVCIGMSITTTKFINKYKDELSHNIVSKN